MQIHAATDVAVTVNAVATTTDIVAIMTGTAVITTDIAAATDINPKRHHMYGAF